ncbi:hypothetical protein NEPAR06_1934 [Nematocida parisii]|uniref:EF-hand domain-containing protein n=1 Tax=Nematocida parisii (strain ERTm3) TaxID=935791 RepID=I3EF21_NEMP3|nr:uncharacterized protein NEPG_01996 [Nematocida parisii ERTm1]EIJ87818.1 hypothetical protein NEQG_01890 [Nematocida parisii ERTm3]KAI5129271.1 hypothetical protein NEPAR03_1632 [Nematocida parisii]EIJ93040.1 hypothetical protein NEPG_01996 [Nematocida parisii ERTm1]KAI5129449.1 hypothetical protein NEPAR08_1599 [Nematocida parisii]KAI5142004.1 hypothetical protein NEPAR04_1360 [Nematocida parisii]|eukprot:XP_013059823.1 hypothetical protein NEPG_01996 [Nematocida parisii ERTm1]
MNSAVQQVFEIFSDEMNNEYVKRQNILPLLQSLGYIINEQELSTILPYGKELYSLTDIRRMTEDKEIPILTVEDVTKAFQVFDSDKAGKLPVSIVKTILQSGTEGFTEEETDAALSLLNPTPEGIIEYTKTGLLRKDI